MASKKIACLEGSATPMGVSNRPEGLNFALYSSEAEKVILYLFEENQENPIAEIPLSKTGLIWHVLVLNPPKQIEYGYRVQKKGHLGPLLIDPYARSLHITPKWGDAWKTVRSRAVTEVPFDWEGDTAPRVPIEELIIYEMHVRAFTQHASSRTTAPGTFQGIIEKIPYLKELGVNAIELLPIHVFNETENTHINPKTHQHLYNFWGYSPMNYFGLMNHYAFKQGWGEEILEFKQMVKALHKAGIEVILDVVYNHTAEMEKKILSMRGIDEKTYYMHDSHGKLLNFTGCGNTLNSNHQIVCGLILDSLRYFVTELHVDGFRFDLASTFCRASDGATLENPAIVHAITHDPLLANTKLIAEAWDAAGLYQVGTFPGGQRWSQWNGKYRDAVRHFIKGTEGTVGAFATALCGSEDLFHKGTPSQSINFITAHDGFTLYDLVSYNKKHNLENGEHNNDGLSDNASWNCGVEGAINDPEILALRQRQMRNFLLALYVSFGIPMFLMGDEYGHTRGGNNNAYCQDNEKNYFLWDQLEKSTALCRFNRLLIRYRKTLPHFKRNTFLTDKDVIWHAPDWSATNLFLAYQLKHPTGDLYIAFNAHSESKSTQLPPGKWRQLVNTSLSSPKEIAENIESAPVVEGSLELPAYSAVMLFIEQCSS